MPIESGGGGNAGRPAIWVALERLAAEQRKANPRLTLEQARAAAYSTPAGKTYLEQWRTAKAADVTPEQATDRRSQAWAKIDAAAETLRRRDSSLSVEKARDQVMKSQPELVAEYRGEEGGAPIGAPADESEWCRHVQIGKSEHTIAELAEARLVDLTKAEQSRNEQLIKLDPTTRRLSKEQAFVVAVQSPEGKEAYAQLRRSDAHLTPQAARQAVMNRIEKRIADALADMKQRDPAGYAAAFGSTAIPAIAAPQPSAVRKWAPYGDGTSERTWIAKDAGGQTLRLRLVDPAGRSHAQIAKAWSDGTLELGDGDVVGSWYFTNDAENFYGRIVKAGSIVVAVAA